MTSSPAPKVGDFMSRPDNLVLFPLSQDGYSEWESRSVENIRAALKAKMVANPAPVPSDASTVMENMSFKVSKGSV